MNDKLSTKERLINLIGELGETALLYEAAGYRADELWEAYKHIIRTMNDVVEELSIPL